MISISDVRDCCGCTACASICRHNAITMTKDKMGFYYPHLDEEKCIDCGLCERVCKFNKDYDNGESKIAPIYYGARHKNIGEINTSRSGAVFIALSDYILSQNGVVYGAGYKEHFRVTHKRAQTKDERNEFKGSKYVQSELVDVFPQVKSDLENGRIVLFSGTPCQTAGLRSYISNKLKERLYLVDIVCHGVPSPAIWEDYLNWLEYNYNDKITEVNFRNKLLYGWSDHHETFKTVKNKKIKENLFSYLFCNNFMLRPSCGNCHFANTTRPSDITIGDFWGYEKVKPEFARDGKGVSLVFANTRKGNNLLCHVIKDLDTFEVSLDECMQPNLCSPTTPNKRSKDFFEDYNNKGFDYVAHKYGNISFSFKIIQFIQRVLQKIHRKVQLI